MRRLTVFALSFLIIGTASCGSGKKYSDIKEFINEVITTQDEFLTLVEKSSNADDMVSAVNSFGDKLLKLSEKSMEIKKRYPEIDKWVNDPPAELKADLEKLESTESRFGKVFMKENVKILVKEKKVQSAFIELNKKMELVKFFQ